MKYDVTHSCGHVVVHELFGPYKERERTIGWLTDMPCEECRIKQEIAEAEEKGYEVRKVRYREYKSGELGDCYKINGTYNPIAKTIMVVIKNLPE